MTAAPNRNIFWAKTFVDELVLCGLEHVVIAPGSRSTPLVIAFAENPNVTTHSVIDERSAAFFALGLGLATGKPAAVLCSSGTATVNIHPAVVEARYAHVPMIILTADRPHELRNSGANQTVDQVKLFGDQVLWFYDVALPEAEPAPVAIRNLRTLAARAYAKALSFEPGPVHLNFPFRKPLEPIHVSTDRTDIEPHPFDQRRQFTQISCGRLHPSEEQVMLLAETVQSSQRGLIICGPRTPTNEAFAQALAAFSERTGYPIFADILSNLRYAPYISTIGGYDTFLTEPTFEAPDLILHFGAMPASSALEQWLNRIPTQRRILISENGVWTDAYHRLTELIQSDETRLLQVVSKALEGHQTSHTTVEWSQHIQEVERLTWQSLDEALSQELFDGSAVGEIINALPENTQVFIASSLPVRHAEQFAKPQSKHLRFYSNRGASGIDGTISSAFGVAAADRDRPTVLITGDLAFYHDMNGLLAAKRDDLRNLTIFLINNDGGGIFKRLPIADFEPPFTDLFLTPHGLDFSHAVQMYDLDYQRVETLDALQEITAQVGTAGKASVVEIRTDAQVDFERRQQINQRVQHALRAHLPSSEVL
jgi:2-succinyl-5-enolpyruvyl-6-hydroxy-3-cyclohexene-1-carboxylate synthase